MLILYLLPAIILTMHKLLSHILNAPNDLNDVKEKVDLAIATVNESVVPTIKLNGDIDVVFSSQVTESIPEDYCGGYTMGRNLVAIGISNAKLVSGDAIFLNICHEVAHAVRWQHNPEWENSLLDGVLFEGLAVNFALYAQERLQVAPSFFHKEMMSTSTQEAKGIMSALRDSLGLKFYEYNREEIFFKGNQQIGLPRWSAYKLGNYLIGVYLSRTGKDIVDALSDKYGDIKGSLATTLGDTGESAIE